MKPRIPLDLEWLDLRNTKVTAAGIEEGVAAVQDRMGRRRDRAEEEMTWQDKVGGADAAVSTRVAIVRRL